MWEDSSWMEVSKILEYIDIDEVYSMNTFGMFKRKLLSSLLYIYIATPHLQSIN
jgi:hypothetical protein